MWHLCYSLGYSKCRLSPDRAGLQDHFIHSSWACRLPMEIQRPDIKPHSVGIVLLSLRFEYVRIYGQTSDFWSSRSDEGDKENVAENAEAAEEDIQILSACPGLKHQRSDQFLKLCHQVRAFWGYLVRADEQSSQPQRDQDFSAPEWMNDAWVSHTNTTKYQHHSNNCISNSLRVLLFDVFNPIKVWSLISTMAMVSSLVAWAEITAGTAWQSAWHGSQHGIDKHWHQQLRCRPSKRLGQQAKNDKMTSKLTQLCSSLFLNVLYISLYIL